MKRYYPALIALWLGIANLSASLSLTEPRQADGQAIAVWVEDQAGRGVIYTSTYDNATHTWSQAETLSSTLHHASNPSVSKDPYGDAVVVWEEAEGGRHYIEGAFFSSANSRWSDPILLSDPESRAIHPQVSKDASGVAIAVWEVSNESYHTIEASLYDPQLGHWSRPYKLSDEAFHSFDPQVSVDAKGDGIVLFRRANGSESVIQSASYNRSTQSWNSVQDVSESGHYAMTPQIGTDAAGRAFAVVHPDDGSNYTVTLHANVAKPQPTPEPITIEKEVTKEVPVYIYTSTTEEAAQTALGAAAPSQPSNFQANVQQNIFPLQVEHFVTLTWDAANDETVIGYNLYLNGELIESFTTEADRSYTRHNLDINTTQNFEVASTNIDGDESIRLSLSLF